MVGTTDVVSDASNVLELETPSVDEVGGSGEVVTPDADGMESEKEIGKEIVVEEENGEGVDNDVTVAGTDTDNEKELDEYDAGILSDLVDGEAFWEILEDGATWDLAVDTDVGTILDVVETDSDVVGTSDVAGVNEPPVATESETTPDPTEVNVVAADKVKEKDSDPNEEETAPDPNEETAPDPMEETVPEPVDEETTSNEVNEWVPNPEEETSAPEVKTAPEEVIPDPKVLVGSDEDEVNPVASDEKEGTPVPDSVKEEETVPDSMEETAPDEINEVGLPTVTLPVPG
ncbi:hypothetical protein FISHEDRAFT_68665 [Fistulina hepatica ATCC 64428]|uniref:Uncharacterized protein n=1 Tax=Fistulina hepatica ATCC 64428 TaxID=1128425 RepID=A0A0D7AQT8_9AGAR|nr:hypothetical protein FISHEDRAFT_68665 [Fistulina hepatica ATCC 64428]